MSQTNRMRAILAAFLLSTPVFADNVPYMVRDVEGVPTPSSSPRNFMPLGDRFVFAAETPEIGRGLWISDGTAGGTTVLRSRFSIDQQTTSGYLNGSIYFRAQDDSTSGWWDIWATDGTPDGTRMILEITTPNNYVATPFVEFGGRLYFGAVSDQSGPHPLWVTDGTPVGTNIFFPGSAAPVAAINGKLLFVAYDEEAGDEPWVTDGTPEGTSRLLDVFPGPQPGYWGSLTVANGYFYFLGRDPTHGIELWRTDGTPAGTNLVRDIRPGNNTAFPGTPTRPRFAVMGDTLYFLAAEGQFGLELWRTDGTEAGTEIVVDFRPGSQSGAANAAIGATADRVFFQIDNVVDRGIAATDGSAAGTIVVIPRFPGPGLQSIPTTSEFGLFSLFGTNGPEVIRSDGTLAGTFQVLAAQANPLASIGERIAMAVTDTAHGSEPWLSDGSVEGTQLVADIAGVAAGNPEYLADIHGELYFRVNDPEVGVEPFRTGGTAETTRLIADIQPGTTPSNPSSFRPIDSGAVFLAVSGTGRPWRTETGTNGAFPIESAPAMGSLLSFTLDGFVYGTVDNVLWRTDGFASNHVAGALYYAMAPLGSSLLLGGNAPTTGDAVFVSDGTSPGTAIDLPIGPTDFGLPDFIGTTAERVYYILPEAPAEKVWSTNGTVLGTDPVPGTEGITQEAVRYAVLNGALYFPAREANVNNLYAIDGPPAAIRIVLPDVRVTDLGVLGDQLFIIGARSDLVSRLWISDGTAEGTELVPDITPRSNDGGLPGLVAMDDAIYFVAFDSSHGRELWRSRGTVGSTELFADINPGPVSSSPSWLTASGDRLYFAANDGVHGNELWALARDVVGDIDGDGDADLQDLSYLLANFGTNGPTGDLDNDGDVDLQDLALLLANFGDSVGP